MVDVVGRRILWPVLEGRLTSEIRKLIRLAALALFCGMLAGPPLFMLFTFFSTGHLPQVRTDSGLIRLIVISAGFGGLMSLSFFLTCGVPARYVYPALKDYPKAIYYSLLVLIASAGGLLGFAVPSYLMLYFFGLRFISEDSLRQFLLIDGALGAVIALIVAAFEKLRADVRRTERLLYESKLNEQLLAERHANAQLRALQAQINPHFLFNTLSSIATLATSDGSETKEMIINLAEIYRHILRCTNSYLVPIEDEMEMVKRYLSIEEVRFRGRLKVEIGAAPLVHTMVPGLILQPIVENAIKHGIGRSLTGGSINIRLKRDETNITIAVCNTSETPCDLSEAKLFVEGHALKNVNDRLKMLYGDGYEFTITRDEVEVCATLRVPVSVKAAT